MKTLEIRVDIRTASETQAPAREVITRYVQWLDLWQSQLDKLRPVDADDARVICEVCCEFDVAYGSQRTSRDVAAQIVAPWSSIWSERCEYFTNVPPGAEVSRRDVLGLATSPTIFYEDIVLGVVAVDPERIGLFFYRSNS